MNFMSEDDYIFMNIDPRILQLWHDALNGPSPSYKIETVYKGHNRAPHFTVVHWEGATALGGDFHWVSSEIAQFAKAGYEAGRYQHGKTRADTIASDFFRAERAASSTPDYWEELDRWNRDTRRG